MYPPTPYNGSHLPPAQQKPDTQILNKLHHLILSSICKQFLGDACPPINPQGWFTTENFEEFLQSVVRKVAQYAYSMPNNNAIRKVRLTHFLPDL